MVPPRTVARASGMWLRGLTAVSPSGDHTGAKLIMAATAAGSVGYLVVLFDRRTAALVALVDGDRVTGLRTAGTSALAADRLARQGSLRVAMLGSGFEAGNHLRALAAVRTLADVRVRRSPTGRSPTGRSPVDSEQRLIL